MLPILSIVLNVAVLVGLPLLGLFLQERVKNAAREATEKVLADYTHAHDQVLAQINAQLQRGTHQFGLFAQRRNEVYAKLYSLFEKARGAFAGQFAALTIGSDYSRSPEPDLRHLVKSLEHISEGDRAKLSAKIDSGDLQEAGRFANTLYEKDSLRRANNAYRAFKNSWVVDALYISPAVSAVITEAMQLFSYLSVVASDIVSEEERDVTLGDRRKRADYVEKLEALTPKLREAMQGEMYPKTAI